MTEEPTEADDPDEAGSTPDEPTRPPVTDVDDVVDGDSSDDGSAADPDGRATDPAEASEPSGESVAVTVDGDRAVPDPASTADDPASAADGRGVGEDEPGRTESGRSERRRERTDREVARTDVADRNRRSEVDLERELLGPEERIGAREEYCNECGAVFEVGADECPECGNPFPAQSDPPATTRKVPRLAAALSVLLPGAGQLYNEQYGKATLAFFGTLVLVGGIALTGLVLNVFLTVVTLGTLSAVGTVLMVLAIAFGWLLPASIAAWDAYDQARSLNAR